MCPEPSTSGTPADGEERTAAIEAEVSGSGLVHKSPAPRGECPGLVLMTVITD